MEQVLAAGPFRNPFCYKALQRDAINQVQSEQSRCEEHAARVRTSRRDLECSAGKRCSRSSPRTLLTGDTFTSLEARSSPRSGRMNRPAKSFDCSPTCQALGLKPQTDVGQDLKCHKEAALIFSAPCKRARHFASSDATKEKEGKKRSEGSEWQCTEWPYKLVSYLSSILFFFKLMQQCTNNMS